MGSGFGRRSRIETGQTRVSDGFRIAASFARCGRHQWLTLLGSPGAWGGSAIGQLPICPSIQLASDAGNSSLGETRLRSSASPRLRLLSDPANDGSRTRWAIRMVGPLALKIVAPSLMFTLQVPYHLHQSKFRRLEAYAT